MVVPVTSFDLKYEDVFTVDIGFAPPPEVWRNFNNQQQTEIAKVFRAPKAMHIIRLTNSSKFPITTAPALIFKDGRVLGQGMATYTLHRRQPGPARYDGGGHSGEEIRQGDRAGSQRSQLGRQRPT